MTPEAGTNLDGWQLPLATYAASGDERKRAKRLDAAGVNDVAMTVLYYLNTVHGTDQQRVLYCALEILNRR